MNRGFEKFVSGLVFGFDVGTGSIGYAVRRGNDFLDVGVLICPAETSDLKGRRGLRRQRRTLRSKKFRREWLANELEKIGLPKPSTNPNDPVALRVRAVNGEPLKPEELHAAIHHLWKRRGYAEVPWANRVEEKKGSESKKEEGVIKEKMSALREEMKREACEFPCQLLKKREKKKLAQRREVWPRDLLEAEFDAVIKAQRESYPKLAEKADWLLFGDTREVKNHHVFFKATQGRNPGVLGLRWPRFDNRGPSLDSLHPVDEKGRPLHVVRKNKEAYSKAQWELTLMNFRVLDAQTRQKRDPRIDFPQFIEALRAEWDKKGKVTFARLKTLAKSFSDKFLLIEDQKPLAPETGAGRARYSSPTLNMLREKISAGRRVDPPQPILLRQGESAEQALNRYLNDIKHPVVRHRLVLFRKLLAQMIKNFGKPDMIVAEAVRSLALSQKNKNELNKRNEQFRKERENAREQLTSAGETASRKGILRFRLWQETKGRCPFCLLAIARTKLGHNADIEHLVPRSIVDCNEIYNLTVAHLRCNREIKRERTPFAAFGRSPDWEGIKHNAEQCFKGRKLEIFLSPQAEELVEQKADLQHTAYIARVIRHIALVQLGWLGEDGRDPTPEKQNSALHFQVTNGQLTSRLRKAWGLNRILHPLPPGKRWDELSEAEQKQFQEKNRGDLRHHALDAMVISCTLPWLAHRTHGAKDEFGNHGWWTQDEKKRSKAANPIGLSYEKAKAVVEKVVVRHHVSRSNHQQAYATTLYAKKDKDTYVAREVFTSLTPKNLGGIWPKEFAAYCEAAWARYQEESADINAELKKTGGRLPESFTNKLCFSHFQQWRANGAPEFTWPKKPKIPIRSVRLISVKDDTAVMPFSKGTHAYVKRTGFREVRIHLAEDEKSWLLTRICG